MGLYLQFCSSYDDLQDFLTIFHLQHSLLHRLCFPHINRPSSNHYFLLFSFALLIFILFSFIYTREFPTEVFAPCLICRYSFSLLKFLNIHCGINLFSSYLTLQTGSLIVFKFLQIYLTHGIYVYVQRGVLNVNRAIGINF